MKGLDHQDEHSDFEDELRAMLRRRAEEVRLHPPDWTDVVRRSGAVVVSLHTGRRLEGTAGRPAPGRSWSWLRPMLAAAACLAIVMAAGIAIGRSTDPQGSGQPGDQPTDAGTTANGGARDGMLAAPGDGGFAPATAAPLFPQDAADEALLARVDASDEALPADLAWMGDPVDATREYLAAVEVGSGSPFDVWADEPDGGRQYGTGAGDALVETARVWWSLRDAEEAFDPRDPPVVTIGYVYLRNLRSPAQVGPDAWTVVGARTQGLDLADVRRDGDQLSFAVNAYQAGDADVDPSAWPVHVLVNGEELNDRPLPVDESTRFVHEVPTDEPATVTLQQLGESGPLSVTQTTFLPDGEPSEADADDEASGPLAPGGTAREGLAVAAPSDRCSPGSDPTLTFDLPEGFQTEPVPGEPAGDVSGANGCQIAFIDLDDPRVITVAWGQPPFEVPEDDLAGPSCFAWASTDDGGLVAVRTDPFPVYVVAEGMTEDDFDQAISSSVLRDSDVWAADEGC